MARGDDNLRSWLREFGMDPDFPDLSSAPDLDFETDLEKVFQREGGAEVSSVLAKIKHSRRTLVRFSPGHGATTFARTLCHYGSEHKNGVYLFLEPLRKRNRLPAPEGAPRQSGMTRVLSEGLIEALLEREYENVLFNGRSLYFDILNIGSISDLNFMRNARTDQLRNAEYEEWFESTVDRLTPDFLSAVAKFHSDANMSTVVCFDIPHDASEDVIGQITRTMKWIEEAKSKEGNFPKMALLEAYFTANEVADRIANIWQADFNQIHIAPYSMNEVFLILTKRYQPKHLGKYVPLNNILDERFLDEVYDSEAPLVDILKGLRSLLRVACDRPREEITPTLRRSPPAKRT